MTVPMHGLLTLKDDGGRLHSVEVHASIIGDTIVILQTGETVAFIAALTDRHEVSVPIEAPRQDHP